MLARALAEAGGICSLALSPFLGKRHVLVSIH